MTTTQDPKRAGPCGGSDAKGRPTVRLVRAKELLGPAGMLRIDHEGEIYTLRITRNDRLILTK